MQSGSEADPTRRITIEILEELRHSWGNKLVALCQYFGNQRCDWKDSTQNFGSNIFVGVRQDMKLRILQVCKKYSQTPMLNVAKIWRQLAGFYRVLHCMISVYRIPYTVYNIRKKRKSPTVLHTPVLCEMKKKSNLSFFASWKTANYVLTNSNQEMMEDGVKQFYSVRNHYEF